MSGLMDKAKELAGKKEQSVGQPGDGVERSADSSVNSKVNDAMSGAGVPQSADNTVDKIVDDKVNNDIPGGN